MIVWKQFVDFWNAFNWSQLLSGIIATLIGVGLALIGNRVYDYTKASSERKKIKSAFVGELTLITQEINSINLVNMSISPLKIPTWESFIASNKIALLYNEKWYNDLFSCYGKLKDYNEWHNKRTNLILNTSENNNTENFRNIITETLSQEGQIIKDSIIDLLKMIQKKDNGGNGICQA